MFSSVKEVCMGVYFCSSSAATERSSTSNKVLFVNFCVGVKIMNVLVVENKVLVRF